MKKHLLISGIIASSLSIGAAVSLANNGDANRDVSEHANAVQGDVPLAFKKPWTEPRLITLNAGDNQDTSILNLS